MRKGNLVAIQLVGTRRALGEGDTLANEGEHTLPRGC